MMNTMAKLLDKAIDAVIEQNEKLKSRNKVLEAQYIEECKKTKELKYLIKRSKDIINRAYGSKRMGTKWDEEAVIFLMGLDLIE